MSVFEFRQTRSIAGTGISAAPLRRSAGLWLGAAVALLAWLVTGPALTGAALGVALALSLGGRAIGRVLPRRQGRRWPRAELLSAPVAVLSWALAAAVDLVARGGRELRAAHVLHRLRHVGAVVVLGHGHIATQWGILIDLLVGGALVSSLVVARALRRVDTLGGETSQAAFNRARAIVTEHGEDSLAPYILRPDKEFHFAGDGVVAFAVVGETVVISGDPVGPPEAAAEALSSLVARAHRAGLRVAAYGTSDRHVETFRSLGLRAVRAGEEAVVDPRTFTLEGRSVRKLRQSVHRIERRGWQVVIREGREIDTELQAAIDAVEEQWRAGRKRILGFAMSMGEFELAIRPDDVYVLAYSPEGELRGVVRFLAHREKLSLDIMRRFGELPNGLTEALVCHALAFARSHGVEQVSLNYAGLAHLLRPEAPGGRRRKALAQRLLHPLRSRFQMDRLVLFNEKFSPSWRPRYLVFESRANLPRAAARVLQAEGYLARPAAARRGWGASCPLPAPLSARSSGTVQSGVRG